MRLFTYGSLMFPEVWRAVSGVDLPGEDASLPGYAVFRVRDALFPGMVADEGSTARGRLYQGIDAAAMKRLDAFEDDYYERHELTVSLASGETVRAFAYVVPSLHASWLSDELWCAETFKTEHLDEFTRRCGLKP